MGPEWGDSEKLKYKPTIEEAAESSGLVAVGTSVKGVQSKRNGGNIFKN